MNSNSSKRHHVYSAENHQNKTDIKQSKIDRVHQISCSENNGIFKKNEFSQLCKNKALKNLEEKTSLSLNGFTFTNTSKILIKKTNKSTHSYNII